MADAAARFAEISTPDRGSHLGDRRQVAGDQREVEQMGAVMPYAAELTRRLEAAARPRRDAFGRIEAAAGSGDERFARAWLAGATYVHAALRSAEYDDWLRAV